MQLFSSYNTLKTDINYNIALYFYGGIGSVYEIELWKKNLEQLNEEEPLCVVVRDLKVFQYLEKTTDLALFYFYTIDDVLSFYEKQDFRVILYVNNGFKNFQSLIYHRSMHIHINHDETEAVFMATNQAKGYDYLFVSGDAAVDRYRKNLIYFDFDKIIKIGRPHYDFIPSYSSNTLKKIILFTPANDLQSIPYLVLDMLINNPKDYYLVYAPYKIEKSLLSLTKKIEKDYEEAIIKNELDPENFDLKESVSVVDIQDKKFASLVSAAHLVIMDYNIQRIIETLYFNKPLILNDLPKDISNKFEISFLKNISKVSLELGLLTISNIKNMPIKKLIEQELQDSYKDKQREKLRQYYYETTQQGKSSKLFVEKILQFVKQQEQYLVDKNMLNTIH